MAGFEVTLYGRIWVTPKAFSAGLAFRISVSVSAIAPPSPSNLEIPPSCF
jgi:hypothetical protein